MGYPAASVAVRRGSLRIGRNPSPFRPKPLGRFATCEAKAESPLPPRGEGANILKPLRTGAKFLFAA